MKFVYGLMTLSLGVIAFGLYLIVQSQNSTEQPKVNEPPEPIGMVPAPVPDEEQAEKFRDAKPGTEAWCEMMMQKANDDWTEEETQMFADDCLYEE